MKILHIGDIAGAPTSFRDAERRNGHKSDVVRTYPHPFDYPVDYKLRINGKNLQSVKDMCKLLKLCLKYDRLHFHKKPTKTGFELVLMKLLGKQIVIHYHGSDIRGKKQPLLHKIVASETYVSTMDLLEWVHNAEWLPTMVIEKDLPMSERDAYLSSNHKFRILHTPTNPKIKGTAYITAAVEELKKEGYGFEFSLLSGRSHKEILHEMATCDLYIDQLLLGFYGTSALECAAMGVPVAVYVKPEFESPFISISKHNVKERLRSVLEGRVDLSQYSEKELQFYNKRRSYIDDFYQTI